MGAGMVTSSRRQRTSSTSTSTSTSAAHPQPSAARRTSTHQRGFCSWAAAAAAAWRGCRPARHCASIDDSAVGSSARGRSSSSSSRVAHGTIRSVLDAAAAAAAADAPTGGRHRTGRAPQPAPAALGSGVPGQRVGSARSSARGRKGSTGARPATTPHFPRSRCSSTERWWCCGASRTTPADGCRRR